MPELSICIVSLDCWPVLQPCLESIAAADPDLSREIILVDNASRDGTPERVAREFPAVRLIANERNVGFSRGTNQAVAASSGRYILWLNPDTLLRPGSLRALHDFLQTHPRAGIVGPKVLNPDGTFQPQCRRGLPTPRAALFYLLGIDRIFPGNATLGAYLLSHLPIDETAPVNAVSGSCLLARRRVWADIGPIDERIFGFGEDIDWCVRAAKAGWEVWYLPDSVIVHLKGKGGAHARPFRKVWAIHQAMWVFYDKHLRPSRSLPVTAVVAAGIGLSLALSLLRTGIARVALKAWSAARAGH
jgi:GT2 family glycosyltransferase